MRIRGEAAISRVRLYVPDLLRPRALADARYGGKPARPTPTHPTSTYATHPPSLARPGDATTCPTRPTRPLLTYAP